MATHAPITGALGCAPAFPPSVRRKIEAAIELLIAMLDALDGDTDIEPNGDERDGSIAEDDWTAWFTLSGVWSGPGCPIADFDIGEDDCGEQAYN